MRLEDIRVNYGKSKVINGLNLDVNLEDKLVVLGRNGVGKTTFLKSIIGILPHNSGTIKFNDEDISSYPPNKRSRLGIAYVPQGREIIPDLTLEENLDLGGFAHSKEIDVQKEKVYELFPALREHRKRKGGLLSGGQQQQLAIGRALMSNPKILLLDEPTEGIQPNIVAEISTILNRIRTELNVTIMIVEQNLRFAKKFADKFVVMQKGQIVASGNIDDLSDEIVNKYLAV